jgi:hypothetical protein
MKVHELIKALKSADHNIDVVLSSDSEGNSYSVLGRAVIGYTINEDAEVHLSSLTQHHIDNGYTEDDLDQTGTGRPCVVLWP